MIQKIISFFEIIDRNRREGNYRLQTKILKQNKKYKNIFNLKKLKESNYNGPITMELCYRYEYLNMGIENFYKKGYEVGEKLKKCLKRSNCK